MLELTLPQSLSKSAELLGKKITRNLASSLAMEDQKQVHEQVKVSIKLKANESKHNQWLAEQKTEFDKTKVQRDANKKVAEEFLVELGITKTE